MLFRELGSTVFCLFFMNGLLKVGTACSAHNVCIRGVPIYKYEGDELSRLIIV